MCARNPGYMSRANGAMLVVDHFLRGLRLIKKKKKKDGEAAIRYLNGMRLDDRAIR